MPPVSQYKNTSKYLYTFAVNTVDTCVSVTSKLLFSAVAQYTASNYMKIKAA